MTLDQIETFINVVEIGSFKAASEKLHRSQPALSVAIKKLEEELGFLLFSREGYRPVLTENGKQFYPRALSLFQSSQSLKNFAKEISSEKETKIAIAIDGLCPLDKVLCPIRNLMEDEPNVDISLSFEVLGGALEKLEEGVVDLAICPKLDLKPEKLLIHPASTVELIPVASELLTRGQSPNELEFEKIQLWSQIIVRDSAQSAPKKSLGILDGARQISVGDLYTKKELLVAGIGWGRMPRHYIEAELRSGALIDISNKFLLKEKLEIVLVHSSKRPQGPVTKKVWSMLQDCFENPEV